MAVVTITTYSVRGVTPDGRQFKIVNREVKRMAETRGEDFFDSHFAAIYNAAQAIKAWRYSADGVRFDVHTKQTRERVG